MYQECDKRKPRASGDQFALAGDNERMKGKLKPDIMLRTFGADPEMFILGRNCNVIPAFKFLPAKEDVINYVHNIFWDGFQAEWSYKRGHENINHLLEAIRHSIRKLNALAKSHDEDAYLTLLNVVNIDKDIMEAAGDRHVEFGCMPSYNIYGISGEGISNPRELLYRFAGGHMHFGGWKKKPNYIKTVKLLDAILGVWAVSAAREFDNPMRRKYYGLAGEFRKPVYADKTYGIEYRTLSNFWLASPQVAKATWELAHLVLRLAESKRASEWIASEWNVQDAINNYNVKLADKILSKNSEMFVWLVTQMSAETARLALIGLGGFSSDVSLEENWNL
jgi:hypothetical protein